MGTSPKSSEPTYLQYSTVQYIQPQYITLQYGTLQYITIRTCTGLGAENRMLPEGHKS